MSEPAAAPGANAHRGETEIALGGTTYVLRPTFEACQAIERATGATLLALLRDSVNGLPLDTLATVVTECLRAHGRETGDVAMQHFRQDRIAALIYEAGVIASMPPVQAVLLSAVTGGRDQAPEKNAPPA